MRLALIGCGSIGSRLLQILLRDAERDLVIFDSNRHAAETLAAATGTKSVRRLDDVWGAKPEAALVCTPTDSHIAIATEAALRGIHLFVEKPLSASIRGVADLLRVVRDMKLTTMVGCNMRYHFGPATLKRILDEGSLGTVVAARLHAGSYLPGWRPGQDYRQSYSAGPQGGVVLDLIHEVDLALWFFGAGSLAAAATRPATSIGLEVDGIAEILIHHASGPLSSVHLNFIQRNYSRHIEIVGTKGTARWDFVGKRVVQYGEDGEVSHEHRQPADWTPDSMYEKELREFLACVRANRPASNPIEEGARTLRLALAARHFERRKMLVIGIIQARMGSSRLPGKVLADVAGRPLLAHVVEGARTSKLLRRVVVATTTKTDDDVIEVYCRSAGIPCYRGSDDDVLARYVDAARLEGADAVVRLTADNPLMSGEVIDEVMEAFLSEPCDYASNVLDPTYPDGTDTEVFTFDALRRSHEEATLASDREHVTTYIRNGAAGFRTLSVQAAQDLSHLRWTVDEPADLAFVRAVFKGFDHRPTFQEVLRFMSANPEVTALNQGRERNEGYKRSLAKEKTKA